MSLAVAAACLAAWAALAGGCVTTAGTQTALHGSAVATAPADAAEPAAVQLARAEAGDAQLLEASAEPRSYYIEFRARPSPASGHSFLVHGPLDAAGRPLEENIVGFYPKGGALGLLAGSTPVPVPGEVGATWADRNYPVLATYRTTIDPAQYRNLLAFIAQERQKSKLWNLWGYNCNSFVGELALAAGLKAPLLTAVPPMFYIGALQAMNEERGVVPMQTAAAHGSLAVRNDQPRFND